MRTKTLVVAVVAIVACVGCYLFGYRSGSRQSLSRSEREGVIIYALGMYRAAETTNLTKLHSFLDTEIVGMTRDYEHRFGVPSGTNAFARDFRDAKIIADRVEKRMVPIASGLQKALGTNYDVEMGK